MKVRYSITGEEQTQYPTVEDQNQSFNLQPSVKYSVTGGKAEPEEDSFWKPKNDTWIPDFIEGPMEKIAQPISDWASKNFGSGKIGSSGVDEDLVKNLVGGVPETFSKLAGGGVEFGGMAPGLLSTYGLRYEQTPQRQEYMLEQMKKKFPTRSEEEIKKLAYDLDPKIAMGQIVGRGISDPSYLWGGTSDDPSDGIYTTMPSAAMTPEQRAESVRDIAGNIAETVVPGYESSVPYETKTAELMMKPVEAVMSLLPGHYIEDAWAKIGRRDIGQALGFGADVITFKLLHSGASKIKGDYKSLSSMEGLLDPEFKGTVKDASIKADKFKEKVDKGDFDDAIADLFAEATSPEFEAKLAPAQAKMLEALRTMDPKYQIEMAKDSLKRSADLIAARKGAEVLEGREQQTFGRPDERLRMAYEEALGRREVKNETKITRPEETSIAEPIRPVEPEPVRTRQEVGQESLPEVERVIEAGERKLAEETGREFEEALGSREPVESAGRVGVRERLSEYPEEMQNYLENLYRLAEEDGLLDVVRDNPKLTAKKLRDYIKKNEDPKLPFDVLPEEASVLSALVDHVERLGRDRKSYLDKWVESESTQGGKPIERLKPEEVAAWSEIMQGMQERAKGTDVSGITQLYSGIPLDKFMDILSPKLREIKDMLKADPEITELHAFFGMPPQAGKIIREVMKKENRARGRGDGSISARVLRSVFWRGQRTSPSFDSNKGKWFVEREGRKQWMDLPTGNEFIKGKERKFGEPGYAGEGSEMRGVSMSLLPEQAERFSHQIVGAEPAIARVMPLYGDKPENVILNMTKPEHRKVVERAYKKAVAKVGKVRNEYDMSTVRTSDKSYAELNRDLKVGDLVFDRETGKYAEIAEVINYNGNALLKFFDETSLKSSKWDDANYRGIDDIYPATANRINSRFPKAYEELRVSVASDNFNRILTEELEAKGWKGILHSPYRYGEYELQIFDPKNVLFLEEPRSVKDRGIKWLQGRTLRELKPTEKPLTGSEQPGEVVYHKELGNVKIYDIDNNNMVEIFKDGKIQKEKVPLSEFYKISDTKKPLMGKLKETAKEWADYASQSGVGDKASSALKSIYKNINFGELAKLLEADPNTFGVNFGNVKMVRKLEELAKSRGMKFEDLVMMSNKMQLSEKRKLIKAYREEIKHTPINEPLPKEPNKIAKRSPSDKIPETKVPPEAKAKAKKREPRVKYWESPDIARHEKYTLKDGTVIEHRPITKADYEGIRVISEPKYFDLPLVGRVARFFENPQRTFDQMCKNSSWAKEEIYYKAVDANHNVARRTAEIKKTVRNWQKSLPFGKKKQTRKSIGLLGYALQEGGLKRLLNMGLKDTEIPRSLSELAPEAQVIYKDMRIRFDEFWSEVNDVRVKTGKKPLPYVENYMTFLSEFHRQRELGKDVNLLHDTTTRISALEKGPESAPFRFEKTRKKDANVDLELDPFKIFQTYANAANRTIEFSPVVNKIHQVLSKQVSPRTGNTWELWNYAPNAASFLSAYSKWLSGVSPFDALIDKKVSPRVNKYLRTLNRNAAYYYLSGNGRSSLVQLTALARTLPAVGFRALGNGLAMSVGDFAKIAQGDFSGTAIGKSKVLYDRWHGGFAGEAIGAFESYSKINPNVNILKRGARTGVDALLSTQKKLGTAGLFPLRILDFAAAHATWNAAYSRGMKLGMGEMKARRFADEVVTRTQGSAAVQDIAPIQRTALGKAATAFQTFVINDWNFITKDVAGLSGTKPIPGSRALQATYAVLGMVLVNNAFKHLLEIQSPYPTPYEAYQEAQEKGLTGAETLVKVGKELVEPVPIISTIKYGGSLLGNPLELVAVKIPYKIAGEYVEESNSELLMRLGGMLAGRAAVRAYDILEEGGDIPDAMIGRYPR